MDLLRPVKYFILCFTAFACCTQVFAQRGTNPLLGMVGRPCGEYFDGYEAICDSLFSGDSLARVELVRLFVQAAEADPTGEWELARRRIAGHVRFFESRQGGYEPTVDYSAQRFAEDLLAIARTAEQKGFKTLYLHTLFNAAAVYRIFAYDYEHAFACYLEAVDEAVNLSWNEFPWKFYLYLEIGDFYFSFREYADAAYYYRKIADDPEAAPSNNYLYSALNGLGLCYRHAGKFEKSDSCFRRILDLAAPNKTDRYVWEGIAGGNIGRNHLLCGNDRQALAWMEPALKKMKRPNDDPYATGLAADIADIYLERGDLEKGKKYLGTALYYHNRSRLPEKSSRLLGVETRYFTLLGDRKQAAACLEAAFRAKEQEQEAFSGLVLRRVEQRLRAADRKIHEQQLNTEMMRSRAYRQTTVLISGTLALILALLVLVLIYYRRTHRAYRELVRRSQKWAGIAVECPCKEDTCTAKAGHAETVAEEANEADNACGASIPEAGSGKTVPHAFDRVVMQAIEQAVIDGKMYKQPDLTLDMLSAATGYNRYYLSGALNRCTGINFSTYVNEQRIKEAVRLMSDPANANLTVDAIAFDAGFNDRKNFYRVFKKVTGLSPTQFRRNGSA